MTRLLTSLFAVSYVALGCASPATPSSTAHADVSAPDRTPARPLAALAAQRLIVLPVQTLRGGDSLGWGARIPGMRSYLASVDDEIAFALAERGLKDTWVYPPALARSARRSPTLAVDPYALGASALRTAQRAEGSPLVDPLASQLRALVALHDARYALVPAELRFEGASGKGRAVLWLTLVDARSATLRWAGDVASDPVGAFSPALAASLAARLAELVVAAP